MHSLKFNFARIAVVCLLLTVGFASAASAVQSQFQILLNLDNQINTGCDVPTLTGTFPGVEQILITTVNTTGSSASVTAVETQTCTNPATDTFGPATPIVTPPGRPLPWPVGVSNGTGGTSVIETFYPLSAGPPPGPSPIIRLGVLGFNSSNTLVDELLKTQPGPGNGPPILMQIQGVTVSEIPTLSEWGLILLALLLAGMAVVLMKRRTRAAFLVAFLLLCGAGLAWAAACDLDGTTTGEWNASLLLASEPVSDAPAGADIRAFYGCRDGALNGICFRIDAQLLYNQSPVANDDSATVAEDASATAINVLANDTDPEADPFTIQSVTQPANGTVVLTPAGPGPYTGLTYTPNGNYCNTQPGGVPDTFTYSLTPGGDTATVSVTVTCVNDNPVANDDTATLTEDDPATPINVLANDTDAESDPFSIAAIVTPPANGTVALTPAGPGPYTGLTYTPNGDYCNTQPGGVPDTFTYSLTPGGDTATVSVTVTCVAGNPVAADDTATVMEDDPATPIDVLANDSDDEGDPFSIAAIVTPPANGTVALTPAGPGPYTGLTYTPNANYCNTQPGGVPDTFTYSLTPGGDTATVSVTVTCINDDPVANDDTATLTEDDPATPIDVLANDTDPENDPFSIAAIVTPPANGTVALTPAGPGPYTGLTYTPNANYCNTQPGGVPDTFTYELTPGGDTAIVSVTVTCVEGNPVAADDTAMVMEDDPATPIDVLANDTDDEGDPFSIAAIVTPPANGTVALTPVGPGPYTGLTYTPNGDYCNTQPGGVPDTFTYSLTPGGDTATVSVTVTCANDNPVANDDTATLTEDDPATPINVLANDTDADNDSFSIAAIVTPPANGTVALTPAGPGPYTGLTYTPNPNYCNTQPGGVPDTFTYSLTPGGDTATVSVTVTCVNDNPVANDDTATLTEDDPATPIDVLANDTDAESDPFSIAAIVTPPANGTVALTPAGPGPYTGLTYTPNPNYCNTQPGGVPDTFTYSLTPGGDTATVSVTVTCINDNPVANDDTATLTEDDPATPINVLANDTDAEGDSFSIVSPLVTPPSNGTVALTPAGPGPYTGLTYTPNPNYCNTQPGGVPDTFTYSLTPGGDTATVSVTVTCVNDNPVANDDTATLTEDDPATPINVLANDTDADNDSFSIAAIVTPPANGTVALTPAGPGPYTGLTYTPNPNYCNTQPGGVPDTFTYSLTPGGDTATVSVTVTCINDNPVANDDTATLTEDDPATPINVLANDTDAEGDSFSIASPLVTPPSNGTVALTPAGPGPYTGLTYTPNPNYCNTQPGGTPDTFVYALTPGGDTATVSVTVTCVNDNPVANDDTATLTEDALATPINVLANDTDAEGDSFSIVSPLVTPPSNGTVALTPAGPGPYTGLTYMPNPNYCNTQPGGTPDTFVYALTPGGDTATVSVTVTCVNDNPVANDDTATLTEDDPATPINVLANDTDVEGDPFSIAAIVTPPSNGTVALTPAGPGPYTGLTYTPNPNYCNTQPGGVPDTFTYSLTPGGDTATVSVTVTCVPDPPSCTVTPAYTTAGNTQLHVAGATLPGVASVSDSQSLLTKGAPTDPDSPGPFLVVPASGNTGGGDWVINMDGSFTFVPNAGFTGMATRTFQVSDNGTPAAIGTCTVNVNVPNEVVWYVRDVVDANNAAGGDGRSTNAFEALASAQSPVSGTGHYIYVFEGGTATTPHVGGFALADGQKLWGQGIDLDLPSFPDLVKATNKARVRATTASINSVNVPATSGNRLNVEIRGLDLEATGTTSNAIDVTSSGANQVGVTISDNNIRGATAEGIDLNSGSTGVFSVTVQTNTVTAAGNGIDTRVNSTGTATVTASSNMITSTAGNAFDARTLAGASALRVALSSSNVAAAGNGIVIDGSAAGTTTITSFLDNTVHQSTVGTGVSVTSATFDAVAGGGINTVDGGTASIGILGDGVGASGMVLTNVQGDLHFSTNLNIFAQNGTGLFVSGTGGGMQFRVASGSAPAAVGVIEATGGPAVDVSAAGLDLRLTSLKSTNTPTRGVSLTNVTDGATNAVFSAGSGSTITTTAGATGPIFNVSGGNADISYAGTINNTSTSARAVSLTTWSGDDPTDDITLSGAIDENGAGILVNGNGGGRPITFSGGMDIDTTTGEGFAATSNTNTLGLHITGTNTIDSVSATALRVTSTTIGSSNLNFQHISSGNNTAAADPTNGIVLNATGTSGRLIVTGTGGAGSGGTIQSTTAEGISLTNTMAPSFASMNIQNTGRSGVKGTLVNGFSLTNTTINNSGTAAIAGSFDSNIAFNNQSVGTEQNLTGTVSITGNTLTNAQYHGVDITNFNGTIGDLTVSNNTITSSTSAAASLGSGINLQALGSATTVANVTRATIANNIITNFPSGAGIQALGANANAAGPAGTFGTPGSGTNVISITGNRVAGQSAANKLGTNGILVGATGKGQANFDVSSNGTVANPLANIAGFGIGVSVRGAVTVTTNVTNNVLAPNNTFASPGISVGADSLFAVTDAPDLTSTISNNTISQTDGNGILATVRNSNGIGRYKIQNNTVAAPLSGVRPGIRVDSGTASGNTTVCLNMSGNTSAGSGGSQGLGLRKQGGVPATNTFGVNGMVATSTPGVEAYVNGLNPAGGGTLLIAATSGFTNCSLP